MSKNVEYIMTVDNEEPDCGRCDHICDDDKLCNKYCGAEHGWNLYTRTICKDKVTE